MYIWYYLKGGIALPVFSEIMVGIFARKRFSSKL